MPAQDRAADGSEEEWAVMGQTKICVSGEVSYARLLYSVC